jgi:transcriptional regulator with XRE-family HTH domain
MISSSEQKSLFDSLKISLSQLAELAQVNPATIYRAKAGKRLKQYSANRLAEALRSLGYSDDEIWAVIKIEQPRSKGE